MPKPKRMLKPQAKVGEIVAITFLDHVEGSDEIEEYIGYGRVAKVSRLAYTIDSWALADHNRDREVDRENIKTFTILRGVIKQIQILTPRTETPDAG